MIAPRPLAILMTGVLLGAALAPSRGQAPAPALTPAGENALEARQIETLMRKACDYQLANLNPKPDNDWIRAALFTGVLATYNATKDPKYLDAAIAWGEKHNWTPPRDQRHADALACGQVYTDLYLLKKDPKMIAPIRAAIDRMMATPKPGRVDWWWCDALYMAPPVLPRLTAATGDPKYLRFLNEMWWDATDFLYDKDERLYYRDANFFKSKTKNGQKVFWSRGNGWVMGGIVRVLQYLPTNDPRRADYLKLHRDMSLKLATLQGDDGLWRTSLLDAAHFPNPETSGTAFNTYAIAWGINNGTLDRERYLPVARRGWRGLVGALSPEGRLGWVQQVAGSPGLSLPENTHEYAVGAFLLAGAEMLKLADTTGGKAAAPRFDFGTAQTEVGYVAVAPNTRYTAATGYGWVKTPPADEFVLRDRRAPDALLRDYVFGRGPATFRVDLAPGTYRLTFQMGDTEYGDHIQQISLDGVNVKMPEVRTEAGQFATLTVAVPVRGPSLDIRFDSPTNNWVINALSIEPAVRAESPKLVKSEVKRVVRDTWGDTLKTPDPTAPLLAQYRRNLAGAKPIQPTGLSRKDYLGVIAGNVDYFKQHQDANGAIIDPVRKIEWQYSTPAFAHSAILLVDQAGRRDLLEPAMKAMDWAVNSLSTSTAPQRHEDFFPPMLAHAFPYFRKHAPKARVANWEKQIRDFDPYKAYKAGIGGGNWNVVALSGEYLFHTLGLRESIAFTEDSLAAQGHAFRSPWGLFLEGPMPYDHFPRLWAADMLAHGYAGRNADKLAETLRRASITSLFMQGPNGELPVGGRSAQHQWNEAEQCVTYEIYAARAMKDGDRQLAAAYKRAAHLALGSMKRWVRPSGEMNIVKNKFEPEERFGHEGYSGHSQYNLLPMSMLGIAYEHAATTETLAEIPAPTDVGGFAFKIDPELHKVFANAGGMYVEIDHAADPHYNSTGLVRVQKSHFNPQLGPSDSLSAGLSYALPQGPKTDAAIGAAWKDVSGEWVRLAGFTGNAISRVNLMGVEATPGRVSFQILYQGYFSGPSFVSERYVLTPDAVVLTTELPDYSGPMQYVWPVLADNGAEKSVISVENGVVRVTMGGDTQTYTPVGAASVRVEDTLYAYHNGYARLAVAEFPQGSPITLRIEPKPAGGIR